MRARILVVDNDKNVRESLRDLFVFEGYEVTAVDSGEAALQALLGQTPEERPAGRPAGHEQTGAPHYDLMLLDLKMPGIDGIETLRQAKQITPDLPAILLTGYGTLESAVEALRLRAQDYLLKPLQPSEILTCVARALSERAQQQRKRLLLEQLETGIRQLKDAEGLDSLAPASLAMVSLPDGITADLARREIRRGAERVSLTPTEGKLMSVFFENRGQVLTHQALVLLVQGYEASDWEAPEVLRPLISRLRRKLAEFPGGEHWIANVRGTGYVFDWNLGEQGYAPGGNENLAD